MTVQINQDLRQTLNHATKGYLRALYGLTRQLNYMCKSMWRWGCSHGAISTIVSRVINSYSCIKHEQISVSKPAMHIYVRVGIVSVCVCVFVHVCVTKGRERVYRGAQRSAVCRFKRWLCGGLRACRPCVWEPRAPHFSYIVLLLLQTVNATKDAQPIVAQDSWGGRAMGRMQAREEGSGLD